MGGGGSHKAPLNTPLLVNSLYTSCISKLMEKLLKDKISEYVVKYGLLNDSQHGFISKKSCLTNLLHFFEIVTDYVDNG